MDSIKGYKFNKKDGFYFRDTKENTRPIKDQIDMFMGMSDDEDDVFDMDDLGLTTYKDEKTGEVHLVNALSGEVLETFQNLEQYEDFVVVSGIDDGIDDVEAEIDDEQSMEEIALATRDAIRDARGFAGVCYDV